MRNAFILVDIGLRTRKLSGKLISTNDDARFRLEEPVDVLERTIGGLDITVRSKKNFEFCGTYLRIKQIRYRNECCAYNTGRHISTDTFHHVEAWDLPPNDPELITKMLHAR